MDTLFLELLLNSQVLRFGEFMTKSGRKSPYFFNTGFINDGKLIESFSSHYAAFIKQHFSFDKNLVLYGPAYKGIPLCVGVSMRIFQLYGVNVPFAFNRKEAKDHGEKGLVVGHEFKGGENVIIVEDILTAGTSVRESLIFLEKFKVNVTGLVVGVDREEKGSADMLAREEIKQQGVHVESLLQLGSIVDFLSKNEVAGKKWIDTAMLQKITEYRKLYG